MGAPEMCDAEKCIREDIRSYRKTIIDIAKWGVTVLVTLQTATFFVREKVAQDMARAALMANNPVVNVNPVAPAIETIPFRRWIVGSVLLLILAILFSLMSRIVGTQARKQIKGLRDVPGLVLPVYEPTKGARWVIYSMYFIFPLFDVILYFYLHSWQG
ncbi:MAG: hypothetical protein ACJ8C4_07140 [Gemmataceae bacterium]